MAAPDFACELCPHFGFAGTALLEIMLLHDPEVLSYQLLPLLQHVTRGQAVTIQPAGIPTARLLHAQLVPKPRPPHQEFHMPLRAAPPLFPPVLSQRAHSSRRDASPLHPVSSAPLSAPVAAYRHSDYGRIALSH